MSAKSAGIDTIDRKVIQLFALVSEALARATHALLGGEALLGQAVVDGDQAVDDLTAEVEILIWQELQEGSVQGDALRYLVAMLLIIPELERSADLAEHIAQRAVDHLGTEMSARSRGIVQLMTEVANEMWQEAADAFGEQSQVSERLVKADDEMDSLHDRLTREIADDGMPAAIAAQVTLLARFYERLGDHAVNLARRIELLAETHPVDTWGKALLAGWRMADERFEVERRIAVDPSTIFRLLCDPEGHVAIDSSGMLMAATGDPVRAVGNTFVVHMDREALNDRPMGSYRVVVTIVELVPDRRIAWTVAGETRPSAGHVFGYELESSKGGALVISFYDWSAIDPALKTTGIFPVLSESTLRATLGILARTVEPGGSVGSS